MSVVAPTWRGLKPAALVGEGGAAGVSRCPDMEGIETSPVTSSHTSRSVSVGAPTWRGLKRAKKPNQKRLQSVSRCPDMEGIETMPIP